MNLENFLNKYFLIIILLFSIILSILFVIFIPDLFITFEYNYTFNNISNETYIYKVEELYIK